MDSCCEYMDATSHRSTLASRYFCHFPSEFCIGALCEGIASCPSPRPQGASVATCLLRQTGGGACDVEIPCKEL